MDRRLLELTDGKRVVLAHGTFDVLHPGHLEHLRKARAMGDVLVVGVTADAFVNKGPGRPVFDEQRRAEVLAALEIVDHVVITDDASATVLIDALRPWVYAKGPDYAGREDGNFARERAAVESHGGRVAITGGFTASSSALVNGTMAPVALGHPSVAAVREKHGADGVLSWLAAVSSLRVLVIGERIVDRYVFVEPMGKSAKENLVTYRWVREEEYEGGASIVAAHLRGVCLSVDVYDGGMEPVVKTRYVEEAFNAKVFSVASGEDLAGRDEPFPDAERLSRYDLVVVADYGHGLVRTTREANLLSGAFKPAKPFTALTVQSNSLNWGYNLLTKWQRADLAVVDEEELRLVCGDRQWAGNDPRWWVVNQYRRLGTRAFALTRGHNGLLAHDRDGFVEMPALAQRVVDRMGAGDAFLAYAAATACAGAPLDVVAFLGSVASGVEVGLRGNQRVEPTTVKKWVKAILA